MCGAGTHPGGGVMGLCGKNCADFIIKSLWITYFYLSNFKGLILNRNLLSLL